MDARRVLWLAVAVAAAVAFVPALLPTGPDAGLDAARFLHGGQLWAGALVVFAGGLLTALTPCVYPLIPITVSVFGARKAEGRGKAVLLTSAYIVGMGVVFSALGVLAAKTGQVFGSLLGHPAVVTGLAVFLLVLASSMFGAFELQLPASWQERLTRVGGSGLLGALLMGSVSGFLAAPCTGPVLTGLLTFVASTQSTLLGAALLFVYALGIGVPFFLIGVFTVRLPRGGVWMEWVKNALGILLVALAAAYLKDAFAPARSALSGVADALGSLPGAAIAAALAAVGVLLGAVHRSFKSHPRDVALKTVGVLLVVVATLVRTGAQNAHGPGSLWVQAGWAAEPQAPATTWHGVYPSAATPLDRFDAALAGARAAGKPVMIDFYADWCAACKELDRYTYPHPQVAGESRRFVNLKVDATNDDEALEALQARYDIQGLPTVVFISSEGKVLDEPRITGFLDAEPFAELMRTVK